MTAADNASNAGLGIDAGLTTDDDAEDELTSKLGIGSGDAMDEEGEGEAGVDIMRLRVPPLNMALMSSHA